MFTRLAIYLPCSSTIAISYHANSLALNGIFSQPERSQRRKFSPLRNVSRHELGVYCEQIVRNPHDAKPHVKSSCSHIANWRPWPAWRKSTGNIGRICTALSIRFDLKNNASLVDSRTRPLFEVMLLRRSLGVDLNSRNPIRLEEIVGAAMCARVMRR